MSNPPDQTEAPGLAPFVHPIRVKWSDCDPALIAFTGRVPYFALDAIDAWWENHTSVNWFQMNVDRNLGTPFVHMSLDFSAPITPRHTLFCGVTLLEIGRRSIRHRVRGHQNGIQCFEGEFVSVFVVAKTMETRDPPQDLLTAIKPLLQAN